MKPLNIVLIVSDDHGGEALGCYGNKVIQTPHLDALAAAGTRFTRAYCTTPSCAASRSVLLTGLHNHSNGTYGHTHGRFHFSCFEDTVSLPRLMKEAGYRTGRIGKKHYAPESVYPFDDHLFDHMIGRDDVRMAESCRNFVKCGDPFFLYFCSQNPHRANRVTSHPLKPDTFGNPEEAFPGDEEQVYREEDVEVPPWLPDTLATRAELVQYYQSISRLDRGVGRLRQILEEEGVAENTVIIYLSDNGAAFPGSKINLYEPGVCLPLIVSSPEQSRRGIATNGLVAWYDIAPTILDYAGVAEKAAGMFGRSFRPIMEAEHPPDWRQEVYLSHTFHEISNYYPMRSVVTGQHKFIWNIAHPLTFSSASDLFASATWTAATKDQIEFYGARRMQDYLQRPAFELYDLEADPQETNNLVDSPEYAPLVEAFCEQLKSFQQETHDPWLHKWEYE